MRRLLLLAAILFALPASAQPWADGVPDEYGQALYNQAFTYTWTVDGYSPSPHQDISACVERSTVVIAGGPAGVQVYDCDESDSDTSRCVQVVSTSDPGTWEINFSRNWVMVRITSSSGGGTVSVQCNGVDNQTFDGSAWVPTFPGPWLSSIKVNGVEATDPDFLDSDDIKLTLCDGPLSPIIACGAAGEIFPEYIYQSIMNSDVAPSANIDGSKIELATETKRGTLRKATQLEVDAGTENQMTISPETLEGRALDGELGGTIGDPTVANDHAGSPHHDIYTFPDDVIVNGQLQVTDTPYSITLFAEPSNDIIRATTAETHGLTSSQVAISSFRLCAGLDVCAHAAQLPTDSAGQEIIVEGSGDQNGAYIPSDNVSPGSTWSSILQNGSDVQVTTSATHYLIAGESIEVTGTTNYNGTHTITAASGTTFDFTHAFMGDDCSAGCNAANATSNDSFTFTNAGGTYSGSGTWTFGRKVTIRDTTNHKGTWTAFNFTATAFDFYDAWPGSSEAPSTYTAIIRFLEGDTTPDVDGGTFFETAENPVVVTNFLWSGAQADEFGHVLYIRSMGKTDYDCTAGYLKCGTNVISTSAGDIAVWVGIERDGTGSTYWNLLSYTDQDQSYGNRFLQEVDPQSFGITHLKDTKFHGYVDVGSVEYFIEDDDTPNVSNGVFFYSYECTDNYDSHCVDIYNSRSGGPCNDGDVQCSGSNDGLCDFDALSVPAQVPQRVGSADTFCDADGVTSAPDTPIGGLYIENFDGGVDGQLIIVVTKEQTLTFDCTLSPQLVCGTADLITGVEDVSQWIYNGVSDEWHLIAFENNNLGGALKASTATKNTFTEPQTLEGGVIYGAPTVFADGDTEPDVGGATNWVTDDDNSVTFTALVGGIDGAMITVRADYLMTWDCGAATISCGTGLLAQHDEDITQWIYDAATSSWLLIGYFNTSTEHNQDYATRVTNTFTGIQDGSGWEITPLGRGTFGLYVAADFYAIAGTGIMSFGTQGTIPTQYDFLSDLGYVVIDSDIAMEEMLTNLGYGTGYGTFWTKTATPNLPMFSDDANNEGQLARIEFDHTWTGLQTFDYVGTRQWDPTPTYDAIIGDLVGGQLRLGTASIGMADSSWAGVATDDIFMFRNTTAPASFVEFLFMGSNGVPRFVMPTEGADRATYNPRSMVIGPAATMNNISDNILCSENFTHIDCNTSATGADLGVQDDLEVLGDIYAEGTMFSITFDRFGAGPLTFGSVDVTYLGFNTDAGALIMDGGFWYAKKGARGFTLDGYGEYWIAEVGTETEPVFSSDDIAKDYVLNYMPPVCTVLYAPLTGEQLESIWRATHSVTIKEIWCETDAGTVGLDINIDDGTPLGINGSDISCAVSTGTSDTSFANSATLAAGDRLDFDIGTVVTAERVSICFHPEAIL